MTSISLIIKREFYLSKAVFWLHLKSPRTYLGFEMILMVRRETIHTFWDYFRNAYTRYAGLRIDHFLLNPSVAGRLLKAQVDTHVRGREKTSDHAPVWIQVKDK